MAILSSVAGEALTKHLSKILPALMAALTKEQGTSQEDIVLEHCQTVRVIALRFVITEEPICPPIV